MVITKEEFASIYENALVGRDLEEKLQIWSRQEKKRALFSGIGSELGPSVITFYLNPADYLIPRYRGFTAIIGKGLDPEKIFGEFMRKNCGTAKGVGDSGSFQDIALGICGYSVVMGANFGTAIGIGLAVKLKQDNRIVVCFFGDGESSRGTFGSALNIASLWKLPILFVCQNNNISMDTPLKFMSATSGIAERAAGYNLPALTLNDKEPLKLIEHTKEAVDYVRRKKSPFLLEIMEERFAPHVSLRGHELFLGKNIPDGRDSLVIFKNFLIKERINTKLLSDIEKGAQKMVDESFMAASQCQDTNFSDFISIYYE